MQLTPKFSDALEYARAHHDGDLRKGTQIPYIAHLLGVTSLVLEHGGDEDQAIAALLHDVVEDGGGERALAEIEQRYGVRVAAIVLACSDTTAEVKDYWQTRKDAYIAHLEDATTDALLVSCADKVHNSRAILADLRVHGNELWRRFSRGKPEQLWYYRTLAEVFTRRLPGELSSELDRVVTHIEELAGPVPMVEMPVSDVAEWGEKDISGYTRPGDMVLRRPDGTEIDLSTLPDPFELKDDKSD